jgi:hypothetical protein
MSDLIERLERHAELLWADINRGASCSLEAEIEALCAAQTAMLALRRVLDGEAREIASTLGHLAWYRAAEIIES